MCFSERAVNAQKQVILFLVVFFILGTIMNWMLRTQERHHTDEMRRAELRIGQVRDECERRLGDQKESLLMHRIHLEKTTRAHEEDVQTELNNLKESYQKLKAENEDLRQRLVVSAIDISVESSQTEKSDVTLIEVNTEEKSDDHS